MTTTDQDRHQPKPCYGDPTAQHLSRAELRHIAGGALADFWCRFEDPDDGGAHIDALLRGEGDTLIEVILNALHDVGALPMAD